MHRSQRTLSNECPTSHSLVFGSSDELLEVGHGQEGYPERVMNAPALGSWDLKISQFQKPFYAKPKNAIREPNKSFSRFRFKVGWRLGRSGRSYWGGEID